MRKIVLIAGVTGFVIAAAWMLLGFMLFNPPKGPIADVYYGAGSLVRPIFPATSKYSAYGPFINAILYAGLASIIVRLKYLRGHRLNR